MAEWGIDLMRLCPDKSILNAFIFPSKINAFIIRCKEFRTHSCFQSECYPQEFEFPCKYLGAMKCSEEQRVKVLNEIKSKICVRIIRFQIIKPFFFFLSNYQPTNGTNRRSLIIIEASRICKKQIRTTLVRVKRWFQCRSQDPCGAIAITKKNKRLKKGEKT